MPRLKKKEVATPPAPSVPEVALTLTAGRSRRTIKPNRKYLNDSIVSMPPSKTSSRSSSPDSDLSEDDYRKNARDEDEEDDDDEEVVPPKSAAGRKSLAGTGGAAKKSSVSPGMRARGRPPKSGKVAVKTEPVKNLRKEVMKKMDLTTLNVGKARVLLTPLKQDPKRKLNLDATIEKEKPALRAREPEKDKAREISKQKVAVKPREPEKVAPAVVPRERAKSEVRVVRKKSEPPPQVQASKKEDLDALKKVINPVAVKKQLVEKSILDKRAKKVDEDEEREDDDDDDDVQIVGISRESNPVLGRKTARKSPLVAKQISPLPRKVPGKATPPVMTTTGLKRKAEPEAKLQGRPFKSAKLSITLDSDVESSDEDVEEVDEEEPKRRTTRSSLPSDKGSASSTPHNSYTAKVTSAKESIATARGRKESDSVKSSLTKSISMPALDKTKHGLPGKSIQTPATKALSKPMAASTPKPSAAALPSKSKSELNLVDPILSTGKAPTSAERAKAKSATIRIVDIGDIMKKRAASTPDIRKDEYDSSSSNYSDSDSDDGEQSKPKTNTELVASILERKQAVKVDQLRTNRPSKRGKNAGSANKGSSKSRQPTPAPPEEEDEIDFEDMLQTNIVTANKVQKVMQPAAAIRQRRSDENINKRPGNNNNMYKSNNNGRFSSSSSLNRSGSVSPHKNPPRILNSTMKMGDNRPFAKLVSNSGNKHYSIDLTDPDNNVKLVASPDSPPPTQQTTQGKRGPPVKTITRPASAASSTGLRNAGNALNKPIGGAVQRSVSALTAGSVAGSPKMKKITCYETWYVINIPNSENKPEKPSFAMSMIGLGNEADKIQLPSAEWSHKIILTKRKSAPAEGDEVFNGDVEDRAISEEEKRNYEPCNIMFRRRTATPGKFNLQYDRAVIFKNDTFFINVDGKNCQLVGAPTKLDDTADIETLLSVVDFVNLKNTCVELSAA